MNSATQIGAIVIITSVAILFPQCCADSEVGEDFEFTKLISVYEYDANRYRKLLHAQDMTYIKWNSTLQEQSRTIGKDIIQSLGCSARWDCGSENCADNLIVRMKLHDQRLQHRIMRGDNELEHAMGRMFDFLGTVSPKECGLRFEKYDHYVKACKVNAYKTYSLTNQVGCTYFLCRDTGQKLTNFHFVCLFDAINKIVVDNNGNALLYKRSTATSATCSSCHSSVRGCKSGLCTNIAVKQSCNATTTLLLSWLAVIICGRI